jgi:hypothetical protein
MMRIEIMGVSDFKKKRICHPEPFGFAQDKLREGSPPQSGGILPGTCVRGNDIMFLILGTLEVATYNLE